MHLFLRTAEDGGDPCDGTGANSIDLAQSQQSRDDVGSCVERLNSWAHQERNRLMDTLSLDSMVLAFSGFFGAVALYFSLTGLHAVGQLIALGLPPVEVAASRSLFTKLVVLCTTLLIACFAFFVATQLRQMPGF